MVYGNLIDKNVLADISICVTALGLIAAMFTVVSYINQVDTSKELQYLPHYNLYAKNVRKAYFIKAWIGVIHKFT